MTSRKGSIKSQILALLAEDQKSLPQLLASIDNTRGLVVNALNTLVEEAYVFKCGDASGEYYVLTDAGMKCAPEPEAKKYAGTPAGIRTVNVMSAPAMSVNDVNKRGYAVRGAA